MPCLRRTEGLSEFPGVDAVLDGGDGADAAGEADGAAKSPTISMGDADTMNVSRCRVVKVEASMRALWPDIAVLEPRDDLVAEFGHPIHRHTLDCLEEAVLHGLGLLIGGNVMAFVASPSSSRFVGHFRPGRPLFRGRIRTTRR